ncbi:hypothetical protein [Couchioplanes caeruleus]|uniref:Uncharacterized protein n=2 Tax=Couchioplanes caeruleus TaxID=56438 RepID=A0A1K0FMS0_9ACTN|nr:hypothetical protein [Couchioplanes caeruleus]OJF14089.1 hypothetical protein BG844_11685 [Couchioplanes caeruleus subsp. caeruleus]ROP28360.1 hypothetical protein EDD30_1110 [Couchioplanes caeruleus]
MTETTSSSTRPRGWWLASLVGAGPHLAVLGHIWLPRDVYFSWFEGHEELIPFALYSKSELIIVPAMLLLTLAAAIFTRTRPLALWLLLGTLAGATLVLLSLAHAAVSWEMVESDFLTGSQEKW